MTSKRVYFFARDSKPLQRAWMSHRDVSGHVLRPAWHAPIHDFVWRPQHELVRIISYYYNMITTRYVVDYQNSRVRRYSHATGIVSTVAGGNGTRGFVDNCTARDALFNEPRGVVVDAWSGDM